MDIDKNLTIEDWLGSSNQLGIDIWHKKYQNNNESFYDWLMRISANDNEVAQIILDKKFLFGGRILATRNIEENIKASYSNCYVMTPPEDSIESIYETCKNLARTYSYGGGAGIDISNLAPEGASVRNQAKTTSGAVSFMDTFSQVTQQICQKGRRGALMISLDCSHPDLEKFITIKNDLNKVNYANISVRVTDDFMVAVQNNLDWELHFERPETNERISKIVKAKDIFRLLCESNWNYAEPGILFWDSIKNHHLQSENEEFSYAGVNPCAEEPLPANGACLLGSINLSAFVKNKEFDFKDFIRTIKIAVKALDVIQTEGSEKHPLEAQRQIAKDWRQIGLGIMGLADMLIKMEMTYGNQKSIEFCNKIGNLLAITAMETSSDLASELGSYPKFNADAVLKSSYLNQHCDLYTEDGLALYLKIKNQGLRNSQLLTIAPTGTLSTMLGISGGIEPIFANSYTRTTKTLHDKDVVYKVYTPIVESYMKEHNLQEESELPEWFVTSATIPIENRIKMQSIWQYHIDASISSTINLPNEATIEDVEKLYMLAWAHGLKGITVYRSGCAREGILNITNNTNTEKEKSNNKSKTNIGLERHLTTGCGSLHVVAFFDEEGNLKNTYLSKGSSGGCNNFMISLSRMISLSARNGIGIEAIIDQLHSCGTCPSYATRRATKHDTSPGSCCPVAIGNALKDMQEEIISKNFTSDLYMNTNKNSTSAKQENTSICPECGGELKHEMGCVTCTSCGYSKCG